jgi:small neutral amino acid transporter SnatA (MarC family)
MHIAPCLFDDVVFSTFDTIVHEVLTVFVIVILSNCFVFTCFTVKISCATTNRVAKNGNLVAIYIISLFYIHFSIYISRFYADVGVGVDITLITHTLRSTV